MNKIILIGRVGVDPDIHTFDSGSKVAKFSFATSEKYKKDGEKIEETDWHNVVFYGPIVDVIEKYVKKGDQLSIVGRVKYRQYEDREGNNKYITEVIGRELEMFGSKSDKPAEKKEQPGNINVGHEVNPPLPGDNFQNTDDIPFPDSPF